MNDFNIQYPSREVPARYITQGFGEIVTSLQKKKPE